MAKQQQDEQSQYAMVAIGDEDEVYLPIPYGLRLKSAGNVAQRKIEEEAENREIAIAGHFALGRQAQVGVGQLARVAGGQFHRTMMQESALLTASKGQMLHECEREFARLNLQQQMQNHFAVNDGVAQNFREQVVNPLYEPNKKPKKWWER